ncbi:hypothetical protein AADZ90_015575 [Aestuariibius sp. 2305UL40-4]|uniref:hypothetical protein n=1 Tax=Aestuariibius violaceus TaxID=3234132 RepID=UPI00345EC5D1
MRAILLIGLIGTAFLLQRLDASSAETLLTNGDFVGIGGDQRFDVHFEEEGRLTISGEFGRFEGIWRLVDSTLCVDLESDLRASRNCEEVTMEGPHSLRVGDRFFLAKLASVLSLS